MRLFKIFILASTIIAFSSAIYASDSIYFELWKLDNLEKIGGHAVQVSGNPQIVKTELGKAVKFDGIGDQLLIDFNPVKSAKEFTIELIFKPDACYPNNIDPRFVQIQDPDDPVGKRIMMELRVNEKNECYLDGFMKTDLESLTLINDSLVHPTNVWHHIAITYKDSILTTYFDGIKELSGIIKYTDQIVNPTGKTSLGARMNKVAYYKGMMRALKVTHAALEPNDFIRLEDVTDTTTTGILINQSNGGIEFFPNPVDQELELKISKRIYNSLVEVIITNTIGNIVYSNTLKESDIDSYIQINTSGLIDGLYFVHFQSNDLRVIRKIIAKH
jgi:hypothetical protein